MDRGAGGPALARFSEPVLETDRGLLESVQIPPDQPAWSMSFNAGVSDAQTSVKDMREQYSEAFQSDESSWLRDMKPKPKRLPNASKRTPAPQLQTGKGRGRGKGQGALPATKGAAHGLAPSLEGRLVRNVQLPGVRAAGKPEAPPRQPRRGGSGPGPAGDPRAQKASAVDDFHSWPLERTPLRCSRGLTVTYHPVQCQRQDWKYSTVDADLSPWSSEDEGAAEQEAEDEEEPAAKRQCTEAPAATKPNAMQLGLQGWAERVNALAGEDPDLVAKCRDFVRKRILKEHATGSLHSVNWDEEPLPTVESLSAAGS